MMKTGLLSIREPYASRIFEGEKRYEFRTRAPRIGDLTKFLVYVPTPRQELAGEMTVSAIVSGPPEEVWAECEEYGGIERDAFFDYFQGRDEAHALRIDEFDQYDVPVRLEQIRKHVHEDFRPPQFFNWLGAAQTRRLRKVAKASPQRKSENGLGPDRPSN